MLYADDLILLAESASDLQMQMDQLSEYAKKWNLEINISKTKVLSLINLTKHLELLGALKMKLSRRRTVIRTLV